MKVYEVVYHNWMRFGIYPGYKELVFQTENEARQSVDDELRRLISLIKEDGWVVDDIEVWDDGFMYSGGRPDPFGYWHQVSASKDGEKNLGRIYISEREGSELEF